MVSDKAGGLRVPRYHGDHVYQLFNTVSRPGHYHSLLTIFTNSMGSGARKYEKLMKNGHWNFRKIIAYFSQTNINNLTK